MIIRPEHMEYASVRRMGKLLTDIPGENEVTLTYALFTTILCWTVQRLRTPEDRNDQTGTKARKLWKEFKSSLITDAPWSIVTSTTSGRSDVQAIGQMEPAPDFDGFTTAKFLEALRNAVSRGDGRNITPINRRIRGQDYLVGYRFYCNEKIRGKKTPCWEGKIDLARADMIRIGKALEEKFCASLVSGDRYFVDDASSIKECGRAA